MTKPLPRRLRRAIEGASRLGYAARGAVYLCVGALALMAVTEIAPRPAGPSEAVALWAEWPLGLFIVAGLATSLAAFSGWRFLQAVFDTDRHGATPRGWAIRAGQAVSGLVYGALAWSAMELLDGLEDIGEADESDSARTLTAEALSLPHGDWIVIAAGLALFGVGLGNLVQGLAQDFGKRLECPDAICRWAVPLARFGYVGRGLATFPLGLFLLRAGLEVRAAEARSWADALQAIESQPFGDIVLALIAGGLAAFGLFGLVEARYRRIEPPRHLEAS